MYIWYKIKNKLYNRKMAKQRMKNGYSDDMCYGMRDWFSQDFPKMINQLRKFKNGSPVDLDCKDFYNLSISDVEKVASEFKDIERFGEFDMYEDFYIWQLILYRIEYCFAQQNEDTRDEQNEYEDDFFNSFEGNFDKNPDKNGLYSYNIIEKDNYKELKEKYLQREKEIWNNVEKLKNEGFDLLKKYFYNLWD